MKPRRRSTFYSFSNSSTPTATLTQFSQNDETTLKTTVIPITTTEQPSTPIPIPIHLPLSLQSTAAATKIQSHYRSHLIRTLIKTISSVNSEATALQNLIQNQETVDSIRTDEREKLRLNEALMRLLLRLDSVPGVDPAVREVRRKVSRRIVGLQEILDAVSESKVEDLGELMRGWEETVVEMEEGAWEERMRRRGWRWEEEGGEMERFCFEKLGFRCMERFLRGV